MSSFDFELLPNITSIGKNAFKGCALTDVNLSGMNGLKSLSSSSVFADCANLKSVTLPAVCTKLGDSVFNGCGKLKSFDFTNITEVGKTAFANTGFTKIDISEKITKWGDTPFLGCNIIEVNIPDGYKVKIVGLYKGLPIETVDLSHTGFTEVTASMFEGCTSLRSVNLDNGKITKIDKNAFSGCTNLQEVTLPKTLNTCNAYAFQNCTSLESIDFSQTALANLTATTVASYIFAGCTMLSDVKLPAKCKTIGQYAFLDCKSLTSFDFSNITGIGKYAFQNTNITSLYLPVLTTLVMEGSEHPFEGCDIKSIDLGSNKNFRLVTVPTTKEIVLLNSKGEYYFSYFTEEKNEKADVLDLSEESDIVNYLANNTIRGYKKVILPDSLLDLPSKAFYASDVEEVILPANLTKIGVQAFAYSKIKTITIPASVSIIDQGAFAFTSELSEVIFSEDGNNPASTLTLTAGKKSDTKGEVAKIADAGVFEMSGVQSITFPKRLTEISQSTFRMATRLEEFTFTDYITSIKTAAFQFSSLKRINFSETADLVLSSGSNYIFTGSAVERVVFPANFNKNNNHNLMSFCQNLTYVEFKGPVEYTTYNQDFQECPLLETIIFPEGITSITTKTCLNCPNLKNVVLPSTLTNIGSEVFANCTSIDRIVIPSSVFTISANSLVSTTKSSPFDGWTSKQKICFVSSEYITLSLLGMDWLNGIDVTVEYDYVEPKEVISISESEHESLIPFVKRKEY